MTQPDDIATDVARIERSSEMQKILQVVSKTTGLRFSAIARVTESSWTACAVHDDVNFGLLPGGQLELESTICNEIRQHHQPVVFARASTHPTFSTHHTPKLYGIESYISVPVFRADGRFFGTLCAIDPLPSERLDDPVVLQTLELFAQLISAHIESEERRATSEDALSDARDVAHLREHFIAVLGHDLRNPLQAISMGLEMLHLAPLEAKWMQQVQRMQRSSRRMAELISDTLDFARGRLGGGIPVELHGVRDLAGELRSVVSEVAAVHPTRALKSKIRITVPVACDPRRVAQLLMNLLANAMAHGSADAPVLVDAHTEGEELVISVANGGAPIPPEKQARLFRPFSRQAADGVQSGLGLGLYIASEIARAHRGSLSVASDAASGTRFEFRMPLHPAR